ncbi:hypothetical protein [Synechococcus sp. MIT S9452]|uniref:hypothetical protein n=1 Tax=Synechococcus sp. MIT S9452 TaxID=3082546 RepID=UPI0039A4D588
MAAPSFEQLSSMVMTIEQLQRRYHWLKYEADFIADAQQASVISEQANQVMAEIKQRLAAGDDNS